MSFDEVKEKAELEGRDALSEEELAVLEAGQPEGEEAPAEEPEEEEPEAEEEEEPAEEEE